MFCYEINLKFLREILEIMELNEWMSYSQHSLTLLEEYLKSQNLGKYVKSEFICLYNKY